MSGFGVITVATGRKEYLRMACALAASVRLNSPGVPTCVITDQSQVNDKLLKKYFDIVVGFDSEVPRGVLGKLFIDKYSPFDRTMFIDADSLVFGDLRAVQAAFEEVGEFSLIEYGEPVTASMRDYYATDDPSISLSYFGLPAFPQLHSGIICFTRGPHAQRVFETAREIVAHVDKLGLRRFGSAAASDEPLLALALARLGLSGFRDNERRSLLRVAVSNDAGLLAADVKKGRISLTKKTGERIRPVVMHFHHYGSEYLAYRRELFALLGVGGLTGRKAATCAAFAEWTWIKFSGAGRRMAWRLRNVLRRVARRSPAAASAVSS